MEEIEAFVRKLCTEGDLSVLTKKSIRTQYQSHYQKSTVTREEKDKINQVLDTVVQELADAAKDQGPSTDSSPSDHGKENLHSDNVCLSPTQPPTTGVRQKIIHKAFRSELGRANVGTNRLRKIHLSVNGNALSEGPRTSNDRTCSTSLGSENAFQHRTSPRKRTSSATVTSYSNQEHVPVKGDQAEGLGFGDTGADSCLSSQIATKDNVKLSSSEKDSKSPKKCSSKVTCKGKSPNKKHTSEITDTRTSPDKKHFTSLKITDTHRNQDKNHSYPNGTSTRDTGSEDGVSHDEVLVLSLGSDSSMTSNTQSPRRKNSPRTKLLTSLSKSQLQASGDKIVGKSSLQQGSPASRRKQNTRSPHGKKSARKELFTSLPQSDSQKNGDKTVNKVSVRQDVRRNNRKYTVKDALAAILESGDSQNSLQESEMSSSGDEYSPQKPSSKNKLKFSPHKESSSKKKSSNQKHVSSSKKKEEYSSQNHLSSSEVNGDPSPPQDCSEPPRGQHSLTVCNGLNSTQKDNQFEKKHNLQHSDLYQGPYSSQLNGQPLYYGHIDLDSEESREAVLVIDEGDDEQSTKPKDTSHFSRSNSSLPRDSSKILSSGFSPGGFFNKKVVSAKPKHQNGKRKRLRIESDSEVSRESAPSPWKRGKGGGSVGHDTQSGVNDAECDSDIALFVIKQQTATGTTNSSQVCRKKHSLSRLEPDDDSVSRDSQDSKHSTLPKNSVKSMKSKKFKKQPKQNEHLARQDKTKHNERLARQKRPSVSEDSDEDVPLSRLQCNGKKTETKEGKSQLSDSESDIPLAQSRTIQKDQPHSLKKTVLMKNAKSPRCLSGTETDRQSPIPFSPPVSPVVKKAIKHHQKKRKKSMEPSRSVYQDQSVYCLSESTDTDSSKSNCLKKKIIIKKGYRETHTHGSVSLASSDKDDILQGKLAIPENSVPQKHRKTVARNEPWRAVVYNGQPLMFPNIRLHDVRKTKPTFFMTSPRDRVSIQQDRNVFKFLLSKSAKDGSFDSNASVRKTTNGVSSTTNGLNKTTNSVYTVHAVHKNTNFVHLANHSTFNKANISVHNLSTHSEHHASEVTNTQSSNSGNPLTHMHTSTSANPVLSRPIEKQTPPKLCTTLKLRKQVSPDKTKVSSQWTVVLPVETWNGDDRQGQITNGTITNGTITKGEGSCTGRWAKSYLQKAKKRKAAASSSSSSSEDDQPLKKRVAVAASESDDGLMVSDDNNNDDNEDDATPVKPKKKKRQKKVQLESSDEDDVPLKTKPAPKHSAQKQKTTTKKKKIKIDEESSDDEDDVPLKPRASQPQDTMNNQDSEGMDNKSDYESDASSEVDSPVKVKKSKKRKQKGSEEWSEEDGRPLKKTSRGDSKCRPHSLHQSDHDEATPVKPKSSLRAPKLIIMSSDDGLSPMKVKLKPSQDSASDLDTSSLSEDDENDDPVPEPKRTKGPKIKFTMKKHQPVDMDSEDAKTKKSKTAASKPESEESPYLKRLRLICRKVGIFIRNTVHLAGCSTDKQKIDRLKEVLRDAGMKGQPSLSKVDSVNLKKEAAALDSTNIIETSGRPKRNGRGPASSPKKSLSPIKQQFSRIKDLISDSDSE